VDADRKAIKEFYDNCPLGYEIDHIIPISKGGQHTLENLQYLTIQENRQKSNKLL
jgi:5-methylcytosine-specific restriction endonuclease McrA